MLDDIVEPMDYESSLVLKTGELAGTHTQTNEQG